MNSQKGMMKQIHVNLEDGLYKDLNKKAREYSCTIQELVELAMEFTNRTEMVVLLDPPFIKSESASCLFTFIDLFAGIGGTRLAFQRARGQCIFSSEWDRWSQKTYFANYGEMPHGDITKLDPARDIPPHDCLVAGFPCQPFSLAGVSKKQSLGRDHGFKDKTQGTLFFNIATILEKKAPRMFLLENVKNLKSHDGGRTYQVIMETLGEVGYEVFDQVIDAQNYVPQHRERIFLVGFRREGRNSGVECSFKFPSKTSNGVCLGNVLEKKVSDKYTLSDKLWNYLQGYAAKHKAKGNGFGYGLFGSGDIARTLSARYHKDGSEILVKQAGGKNPRRLTPHECGRLMGFPEDFVIPVSDTQAYRQFGNSVVVPVVEDIAKSMVKTYRKLF